MKSQWYFHMDLCTEKIQAIILSEVQSIRFIYTSPCWDEDILAVLVRKTWCHTTNVFIDRSARSMRYNSAVFSGT